MALLEVDGLTKRFGGLVAVDNLGFQIDAGEIVGLIGPNGAGKTTVFNLICGVERTTNGTVRLRGEDITNAGPHRVAARGVVRTFQETALFGDFRVLDNVLLGCHLHANMSILAAILHPTRMAEQEEALRTKAADVLKFVGLDAASSYFAKNLAHGHQRLLGLAIALATDPSLLLLDEPATGMNAEETSSLVATIERIRAYKHTVLLVEHDMRVVMGVCDRIVVMNFGRKIAEGTPEQIAKDERVIQAYLGAE